MNKSQLLRALAALGLMTLTTLTTLGCGDGNLCREQVTVTLTTPTGVVNVDGNPELAGTQLDVVVTTNAQARVPLLLKAVSYTHLTLPTSDLV